jgi:hypothetical protein
MKKRHVHPSDQPAKRRSVKRTTVVTTTSVEHMQPAWLALEEAAREVVQYVRHSDDCGASYYNGVCSCGLKALGDALHGLDVLRGVA